MNQVSSKENPINAFSDSLNYSLVAIASPKHRVKYQHSIIYRPFRPIKCSIRSMSLWVTIYNTFGYCRLTRLTYIDLWHNGNTNAQKVMLNCLNAYKITFIGTIGQFAYEILLKYSCASFCPINRLPSVRPFVRPPASHPVNKWVPIEIFRSNISFLTRSFEIESKKVCVRFFFTVKYSNHA